MTCRSDAEQRKAESIIGLTSQYLKVPVMAIMSNCRKREYTEARHFAMYFIRKNTELSLTEIGDLFGKDHASVFHATKIIKELIEFNGYRKISEQLSSLISVKLPDYSILRNRRRRYHYRAMMHKARRTVNAMP